MHYKLSESEVQAIISILEKGDRVELIPTKDKVKIIQIKRKETIISHKN